MPSYRELAERNLDAAAQQIDSVPRGTVLTDVMQAHASMANALATVALTQAVLHLGDLITGRPVCTCTLGHLDPDCDDHASLADTEGDQTPGG